jgi:large conductance mechanosensitive channel
MTEAAVPAKKKGFLREFREFIASGNLIQLAVAFILGAAIAAVIKSFTDDIMMQLVAAIFGKPDFSDVTITLRHNVGHDADGHSIDAVLRVGTFLNALISLVLTGLVLFVIVKLYNNMRRKQEEEAPGPTEVELLTQIRDELRARG